MYTASQDFTLACAVGTGATVVRSAVATSIITQRDANVKALGMARALAVEDLVCTLTPDPTPTIYYSVEKTGTANNTAGHVTETFEVVLPAGSIYSLVSQEEADTAAQTAATWQAEAKRDAEQRPLYESREVTLIGHCGSGYEPHDETVTIAAGDFTSETSQAAADALALAEAESDLAALLTANCVQLFLSEEQTYTASCGGGEVGSPVTITLTAGYATSTVSQAAANATALAAATAQAEAMLECDTGFFNEEQTFTAECSEVFGPSWFGSDSIGVCEAGEVFDTTQELANAAALGIATGRAYAGLSCRQY
jgi:hypothetical protein